MDKIAATVGSGALGILPVEAPRECGVYATGADERKFEVGSCLPDDADRDYADHATLLLAPNFCILPASEV